tara:strand:- start:4775 stop:5284 length:510 start_codon:yes stop_codon:yes gene_type:complete
VKGDSAIVAYAVLTSSDKGSLGKRTDTSGDAVVEMMQDAGHTLVARIILPDEFNELYEQITAWSDAGETDVILTTGGTGLSRRDIMPEVMKSLIDFDIPGMAEAMRSESLNLTKMSMISRAVVGVRGSTLIINLPGSTAGVKDNLAVVVPVITHAVEVLQGRQLGPHPA